MRQLRTRLDGLLAAKPEYPARPLGSDPVVAVVEQLLSADGY